MSNLSDLFGCHVKSKTQVCWVWLGCPTQDTWVWRSSQTQQTWVWQGLTTMSNPSLLGLAAMLDPSWVWQIAVISKQTTNKQRTIKHFNCQEREKKENTETINHQWQPNHNKFNDASAAHLLGHVEHTLIAF